MCGDIRKREPADISEPKEEEMEEVASYPSAVIGRRADNDAAEPPVSDTAQKADKGFNLTPVSYRILFGVLSVAGYMLMGLTMCMTALGNATTYIGNGIFKQLDELKKKHENYL